MIPSQTEDPNSLHSMKARFGKRHRWWLLLSVMLGTMASVMSSTIMNVGIPGMSHHFSLNPASAQWVTSGFMVAMTVGMLITPWMLSRFGYRRTYQVCMWLLMAGGIAGGLSPWYGGALLARVIEGLAAGVVQPIPVVIIMNAFEPHERGRASGLFGTGVVMAPAIGPSIGGLLVDAFGWRSIFFMVVPLAIMALWLARRYVPTTAPGGVKAGEHTGRLDVTGLLLSLAGTVALLLGLVWWRERGLSIGLPLLGVALVIGLSFVRLQRHLAKPFTAVGKSPLMDLNVFAHRQFAMGSLVAITYGTALFGSTYLLPVYMQSGLGLSASYVGTALLPAGLMLALTINLVGRWSDRTSKTKLLVTGLVFLASSFALIGTVNPEQGLMALWVWVICGRVGLGFILPSLNLGAMQGMPKTLISQGSSTINFMRTVGGAVGVSLCAIVLEWRLDAAGLSRLSGGDAAIKLQAFRETFAFLAAITALAIWPALRMGRQESRA